MRHFARRLAPLFVLAGSLVLAGCDLEGLLTPRSAGTPAGTAAGARGQADVNHAADTISIASFNVQVFGVSKLGKPEVMDVLARVVRRFDVVAVQEIRSADQSLIPAFVKLINADGSRYDFILGERLGRTSSKEQYAYVYDTDRIEVLPRSVYTAYDRGDRLHRAPLVTSFRVRDSAVTQ
ncbi:MAG TPA: endonuclease/exonuclease/phosphatase family protein, partial [Planctomycetaceae bacterium]|nr:endonuclease/exonuclease/phosphatase family protein [Planctomycetaceae bacterium]